MKQIAILFLVLVLSNSVSAKLVTPWTAVFAEVQKENEFGKAIGSMIEMHLQNKDVNSRLNEIRELIESIKSTMDQLATSEDAKYEAFVVQCDTDITNFQNQVTSLQSTLNDFTDEQQALIEERGAKSGLLSDEESNYLQMIDDKEQAQLDLEAEIASYTTKNDDYQTLYDACMAGVDLLVHMIHGEDAQNFARNGVFFVQLSKVAKDFGSVLGRFREHSSTAMLEPVVTALTSLSNSSKINYDEFLQCIQLLQDIASRLKNDQTQLTRRHEQIVTDLEALIKSLEDQIFISNNIVGIYTERIIEIKARLSELEGVIADTTQLLSLNESQLAAVQAECELGKQNYATENAARLSQIAVVERLIDYFNNEVQTAGDALRDDAIV